MQFWDLFDYSSFTSLWYWIFLGLTWNSWSHVTFGVPFDVIVRADMRGAPFEQDVDNLAVAQANRLIGAFDRFGVLIAGLAAFVVAGLGVLAFGFLIPFAQAAFVLVFPLLCVSAMEVRLAYRFRQEGWRGNLLRRVLVRRRFYNQLIGVGAIATAGVFTAYYGLARELTLRWF